MTYLNKYYAITLFCIIFIYIPLNNTLLNLNMSSFPTLTILALFAIIGLIYSSLNLKSFITFVITKNTLSLLFVIISSIILIFSTYVMGYTSYVPSSYLFDKNIFWFIYTISGFLLAYYYQSLSSFFKNSKYTILISYSLGILVFLILFKNFSFWGVINRSIFDDVEITYQLVADMLAILSFITIAKYYKSKVSVINFFITLIMLLILSSRSSLFFYVASIVFLLILNKEFKVILISFITVFLFSFLFYDKVLNFYKNDKRALSIITFDASKSNSLKERTIMLETNLENIKENWFTGNIYGEFITFGKSGTYIHNYLSYLQNFGFIPFIILNLLLIRILYQIIKFKENTFDKRFLTLIFMFTLFSMLFTRGYTAMYLVVLIILSDSLSNKLNSIKKAP